MRIFDFGKKDKIIDLSNYKKQRNWPLNDENDSKNLILNSEQVKNSEEKKKKLAKRITDLTDTIENLSNQVYHLQQRVELLEKKFNINSS